MTSRERVEKRLPSNFPKELMDAMETNFGSDRAIDLGNITIDTSNNYTSSDVPVDEFDTVNATCEGSIHIDNETEKGYIGKKRKSTLKTIGVKDTILENNKLVVSTLQLAEEGRMKRHETNFPLMERRLDKEEQNDEKLIKLEEQKVNVQMNLVAALNSIGQAMLKISESFCNDK
ncbi:hypothetical protein SUGI_0887960 [Cryptomeria japonica]|nr:hypothetical protein SUGI_0887960 [Cryptomeria japonica]